MEETIKLYNRDKAMLSLKRLNKYVLEVDEEHSYILEYMRLGLIDGKEDEFCMADPAGGPYIVTGGRIKNKYRVERIYRDRELGKLVLELTEEEDKN